MIGSKSNDMGCAQYSFKIIGFIGCDGVGTTTHANHAVDYLQSKDYDVSKEWIRFNYRFSLPILALARVIGLTELSGNPDVHRVRAHRFERSELLTNIYKRTVLLDQYLLTYQKFNSVPQGAEVLVCDRFILDALVDLVVSTKKFDFLKNDVAQQFWRLVPSQSVLIGLDCDAETIASRRDDVAQDPFLKLRTEAYQRLFNDERINTINTSAPLGLAKRRVEKVIDSQL